MILMETDYSTTGGFTMRHGRNGVWFFLSISIPEGGGGASLTVLTLTSEKWRLHAHNFDWKVRKPALAPMSYDDDSSLSTTSMVTGRPWLLLRSRTLDINLEHLGQGQKRGAEGAGTPFINIAIMPWTYPRASMSDGDKGLVRIHPTPSVISFPILLWNLYQSRRIVKMMERDDSRGHLPLPGTRGSIG